MKCEKIDFMGMEMEKWTNKHCFATFGIGDDWATLYSIESYNKGKGEATELLKEAKNHYEKLGKKFGSTVALNPIMKHILVKLNIKEYK